MKSLFLLAAFSGAILVALLVAMSPEAQAIGKEIISWIVELAKASM